MLGVEVSLTRRRKLVLTLAGLLVANRNYYVQHETEARLLVGRYPGKDVRESAAWVATLRMLLNLDEFINRG